MSQSWTVFLNWFCYVFQVPDVRAALAVALYAQGLTAEAETNWGRMQVSQVFLMNTPFSFVPDKIIGMISFLGFQDHDCCAWLCRMEGTGIGSGSETLANGHQSLSTPWKDFWT